MTINERALPSQNHQNLKRHFIGSHSSFASLQRASRDSEASGCSRRKTQLCKVKSHREQAENSLKHLEQLLDEELQAETRVLNQWLKAENVVTGL
jgi:hypothetical protein